MREVRGSPCVTSERCDAFLLKQDFCGKIRLEGYETLKMVEVVWLDLFRN